MLNFFSLRETVRSFCTRYTVLQHLFCASLSLVYADETFSTESFSDDTVLVLPPSDYWALRVNLNVTSEKEAATYGPALFEHGDMYRYEAQLLGDNIYILIAYNPEEVSQKLLSNPSYSNIKRITFAQWVFADIEQPIYIESSKYLTTIDGIVIEIDAAYLNIDSAITLNAALSSPRPFLKHVKIDGLVKSTLTPKTFKTTLLILLILFGNLVAQAVMTYKESDHLQKNIEEILNEYKLQGTSIERVAILESLRSKEIQQLRFRDQYKLISDLHLEVKKISTLSVQPLPTLPIDGIVLIPGSNPGEPNRLLVEEKSSSAAINRNAEGMQELVYDGHSINLIIDTHDRNANKKLKEELLKQFTKAQVEEHDTQLEVWIK